jgi:endoglucanase
MSVKTAMQYFRDEGITVGMNLGNSLDAYEWWSKPGTIVNDETAWHNPRINQTHFNGLSQHGFKIVRIPVTYIGVIGSAPDYKISEAKLRRVGEVVYMAKNAGLKVVINMHHDGYRSNGSEQPFGWLSMEKALASETDRNQISDQYGKVWKQIAEYFKNFGDYLMFQGFNEVHDGSWDDGTSNSKKYQIINDWNQKFTNAVRSTGGNNANRYLLYYGYNTSLKIADASSPFVLPTDSATGRQAVGFHFYEPFNFAHDTVTHEWPNNTAYGGAGTKEFIDTVFGNFKTKFINNNIPVIIGENGPFRYSNYIGNTGYNAANVEAAKQNRLAYVDYMYGKARENEIVPFFWEGGQSYNADEASYADGDLFNRNTGQPNSAESKTVIERMIAAVNSATPGGDEGTAAVITWGDGFADTENGSSITVTKNGSELTISGNAGGWGAGVYGTPDESTLAKLKSMTSMTFSVLGDGNSYRVMFPTPETDGSGDHFGKTFSTTNGQKIIITVNISDLAQNGSGATFIQNNVKGLQFHPAGDGTFSLKVTDIRTNP